MKHRLSYIICAAALVAGVLSSCEDHRRDYLDEFTTVLYFRNGSDQDLTLFRTGEDYVYQIPVCKAGSERETTAQAQVIPYDDAHMTVYNSSNLTSYYAIPHSCYTFVTDAAGTTDCPDQSRVDMDFGKDDFTKIAYVKINVSAVSSLMEEYPDREYRLAFQLFSDAKVGSNAINLVMIRPIVEIPRISLGKTGFIHNYIEHNSKATTWTPSNSISVNMKENKWDIQCQMEVKDDSWLKSYNEDNGTDYELLPAEFYRLPEGNSVKIESGRSSVSFVDSIIVNTSMTQLAEYILPIALKSSSMPAFELDDAVYMIHVRRNAPKIEKDDKTRPGFKVTVSHNQDNDGGGAPALTDNDYETYWHSPWSSYVPNPDPDYGIYIQIDLGDRDEDKLSRFALGYRTRSGNSNGVPTVATIGVSNDGKKWKAIRTGIDLASLEGAQAASSDVNLPAMRDPDGESFRYIRFGFTASKAGVLNKVYTKGSQPFVSLAEIRINGVL